jgi:hypothetical protein
MSTAERESKGVYWDSRKLLCPQWTPWALLHHWQQDTIGMATVPERAPS